GKVTIRGQCVDCNRPEEESTTRKSSSSHDHGGQSKTASSANHPSSEPGSQVISSGNRFKRQWGQGVRQVINLDGSGESFYRAGGVTTIDGRGYPGTVVRNSDCVGCNIRG
ncbi:hypothetical protein KR044_001154, partial [Drosophila immigrans]